MQLIKNILPICCLCLLTACGATTTTSTNTSSASFDALSEWGDLYGQTYFTTFETQSGALSDALGSYCEASNDDNLDAVQQAWLSQHKTWQTLRIINVAPLTDDLPSYSDRIYAGNLFDGDGESAVDSLLDSVLPVTSIANESVLVQGIPALEYILFKKIPEQVLTQSQCLWAINIADNLAVMATYLRVQWLENLADFKNPAQQIGGYSDRTEVLAEVLNGLNEYIEIIARYKINRPMGIENSVPDTASVEGRFSGESLSVLMDNILGINRLLVGGEHNVVTLLQDVGATQHVESLQNIMTNLDAQLQIIAAAGVDVLSIDTSSQNAPRTAYLTLHEELTALSALLFDHVIDAVGGTALFNSVDGD